TSFSRDWSSDVCSSDLAFEQAETGTTPDEQQALLTFVVVGGGATGVEMAGAIAELSRHTLPEEFRRIETAKARILLVEAGNRIQIGRGRVGKRGSYGES